MKKTRKLSIKKISIAFVIFVVLVCLGSFLTYKFNLRSVSSEEVAKYGIDKALSGKFIIIPETTVKIARVLSKISPDTLVAKVCYHMQEKKRK